MLKTVTCLHLQVSLMKGVISSSLCHLSGDKYKINTLLNSKSPPVKYRMSHSQSPIKARQIEIESTVNVEKELIVTYYCP